MPQDTEDFANSGPLPLAPADLDELARWVPKKEMALLIDLCERAWHPARRSAHSRTQKVTFIAGPEFVV